MATLTPVRSIKRFLKASPSPTASTSNAPIERLPAHVISAIGRQSSLLAVLHLSRCSHRLRSMLAPLLYSTVELKTNKQCKTSLVALSKRPEISQHIRRLIIRPNSLEWTDPGDEIEEGLIATLVASMAPQLRTLEAFEWDGMEMPSDNLWTALKKSCRNLRRISTTIGEEPLNPSSPLWDFSDLRQVSLTAKCHSLDWLAEGLPKTEKLPRKFWAMLLERCPRLEELTIGGPAPSPRIFDIRHITAGRWPRLRGITLGDMVLISSNKSEEQARKDHAAFMAFFAAHPTLKSISLQHAAGSAHFPSAFILPPKALPNLDSFGGPLKFVRTLPNPRRLRHLTLTCLHHSTSAFPPTFAVLKQLRGLVSLSIWIDLFFGQSYGLGARSSGENGQQKLDDVLVMHSLLASCPGLKQLDVACFTRPTFWMREFSKLLRVAPNLESFTLTKVHKSNEEDMTRSAARIAVENPNLRKFTLRTTQDSWFSAARGRVRQLGVYELLEWNGCLGAGMATSMTSGADVGIASVPNLLVYEWGQRSFISKEYSRHFVHPLTQMLTQKREQQQGPPVSASAKHNRPHSNSLSVQLPLRCSSIKSLTGRGSRIRRASCSVVDSITAIWHSQNDPVATQQASPVASPRSSMSSGSGSMLASVTWADKDQSSRGRSMSGSTTGSTTGIGGGTHSPGGHAKGITLAFKNAQAREIGKSEQFKQRGAIKQEYVLS